MMHRRTAFASDADRAATSNATSIATFIAAFLLIASQATIAQAAGDAAAGKAAFAKCASCHEVGRAAHDGFGPQLNGIVGRQAGAAGDFNYSPAMKKAGFVWTEDKLRAFLKSTDDVVPGNKMRFWGIRSDREIDDLLAYLRSFPPIPAPSPPRKP